MQRISQSSFQILSHSIRRPCNFECLLTGNFKVNMRKDGIQVSVTFSGVYRGKVYRYSLHVRHQPPVLDSASIHCEVCIHCTVTESHDWPSNWFIWKILKHNKFKCVSLAVLHKMYIQKLLQSYSIQKNQT